MAIEYAFTVSTIRNDDSSHGAPWLAHHDPLIYDTTGDEITSAGDVDEAARTIGAVLRNPGI